jgi:type IV pilus assembly protein PilB
MVTSAPSDAEGRRTAMVQRVVESCGVFDASIQRALVDVPREAFLAPEFADDVQEQHLPLSEGQTLPPPEVIATLIDALRLAPDSRVLEVGTGSGYAAALLSRLAADVFTVERLEPLARLAQKRLAALGYRNVEVRHGEGAEGWPERSPFDAILVSAGVATPPRVLLEQLGVGGRLVVPVGPHRSRQIVVRYTRTAPHQYAVEQVGEIRFVSRLGDLLVDMGAASRQDVEDAARSTGAEGQRLGERLVERRKVEEADVFRALAVQRGIRFGIVDQLVPLIDLDVVRAIPRAYLERYRMIPLARRGSTLIAVTADADAAVAELGPVFQAQAMETYLVTPTDYRRLWAAINRRLAGEPAGLPDAPREADVAEPVGVPLMAPDAKCVALFDALLLEAVGERASDLHIERYGSRVRVRLRVDGELRDLAGFRVTPEDLIGLVNVIKIKANLDIAERRLPQGGRIGLRASGQMYDLRVQTQPSLHGEHVVIRLLPQDVKLLTIEDLGFPPAIAHQYRRLLDSPAGLVLAVGPTGSGKSTTLYAGLQVLARDATRKVITVEDPIEYSITGIQQTQVHAAIGFAFHHAMRSFVRQDPDVILVGEIRDGETALEAIRASQTGHLVLSTLHSNDAVDAVQRLFDLGMHPNSIASELLAVIAQRLAKRVCDGCRMPATPEAEIVAELFPEGPPKGFACFRGRGCPRCAGHGTHGRIAAIEYLRTTSPIRRAISRRLPVDELRDAALAAGLVTMRDSALQLVAAGVIPLSEVPRILPADRMAPERRARSARG